VQGLPAFESLLYTGSKALLAAGQFEDFRCALALAVANNLDAIAGEVLADWQAEDGWASLINNPGPDNPVYRTHAEAMTEILKAIVTALEQDRDQRLLPALGDRPEAVKASRAPYNASGQALPYLAASAEAIERFVSTTGMLAMLPADQKAYGASVLFEFSNLRSALDAAGPNLEAALADPDKRGKLTYAIVVLQSIRDLIQRHVAVAAGLSAGFNSLDGD
jgi:predicted lipoprotein